MSYSDCRISFVDMLTAGAETNQKNLLEKHFTAGIFVLLLSYLPRRSKCINFEIVWINHHIYLEKKQCQLLKKKRNSVYCEVS